ncbi:MAG: hypothetical protein EKK64_03220 [Neisseriaceae bacterium]|nr:MAG: hypothetical protein EKK64_03220 [Neisseriaceae bacterium]
MKVSLPFYAKIKDRCCLCYFGYSKEYLVQLNLLLESIETELKGIVVHIACNSDAIHLFDKKERILTKEQFESQKETFAFIKEINCDTINHPIEKLMDESKIPYLKIKTNQEKFKECVVLTNGHFPTKNLNEEQIKKIQSYLSNRGIHVEIDKPTEKFNWIVSVENEELFSSVNKNKKITLIPSGVGTNLFKKMFESPDILDIL